MTIVDVDYAPSELHEQCPIQVHLFREIPGPDRPDYWIGKLNRAVQWADGDTKRDVHYLVLAARWEGMRIEPNTKNLPVGIAYVTDETLLDDALLDLGKCSYVAIGISHIDGVPNPPLNEHDILAGTIGRSFGKGQG